MNAQMLSQILSAVVDRRSLLLDVAGMGGNFVERFLGGGWRDCGLADLTLRGRDWLGVWR